MILNIGLSPCIDVNMEVDSLSVGMTNYIISKRIFYTGKAVNTAIGLAQLGADSFLTGFMYEDNGQLFEQQLHREGVNYKFIWNKGRVRENYKFIDHKSMLTEVNDMSPEVSEEKQSQLIELVARLSSLQDCEAVVMAGGLAKGMGNDYYAKVLSAVPQNKIKVVDTDGEKLLQSLKCGIDLVKPNIDELQRTFNKQIKNKDNLLNVCHELIALGAKRVLVSLGKNGAVITDGKQSYYCKSSNVAMNSTVGAGDAMVAAATKALVQNQPLPQILKCGVAAGTAAVTSPDRISFYREKYEEIFSTLTVKQL